MDGYPMPIADLLVDAMSGHKVISFMDGNAGYNKIFMADGFQMPWCHRPIRMGCDDFWFEEC
jgi:hypothetical protein